MYARSSIIIFATVVIFVACSTATATAVLTYGGNFNLPIPAKAGETQGWMDDAIVEIPDHLIIEDLDVGITVTHSSLFDLQVHIQGPDGTDVLLNMYNIDKEFFWGQNYTGTIFDDEADTRIEDGSAPFTGRFRPRGDARLSVFDGTDTFGTWKLRILDIGPADTGRLENFRLFVTVPEPDSVLSLSLGGALMVLIKPRRRRISAHCD
jgi:subtilisin-like proprotein convertase family protein